jgi:hypothetical protein
MAFFEKGPVRTHYQEAGSGFPVFMIPGGGQNSTKQRPDLDTFLTRMYVTNADFVFSVPRDVVRACPVPVLVMPDETPSHP